MVYCQVSTRLSVFYLVLVGEITYSILDLSVFSVAVRYYESIFSYPDILSIDTRRTKNGL